MIQFSTWILVVALLQTASLDSPSPKERMDAVESLALPGRSENVPALAAALQKEPRSDVRAGIVAGLGRIGGPEVLPILVQSLQSDLDKDVRLQVVDSLQRLYIPVNSQGPIKTVFNKVKSVFAEADRPVVANPASVDPKVNAALADTMQKDFSDDVRAASARALGSLRARDRVAVLVSTLESPQSRDYRNVRLEIVESLGLIRDEAAGPALHRAIKDPDRMISQAPFLPLGWSPSRTPAPPSKTFSEMIKAKCRASGPSRPLL
jgi:HEAT repeat protein